MKKINFRNILLVILTVIYNSIVYSFGRMFPDRVTLVSTAWDLKIPYVGFFIYFYISWYVCIFIFPYLISLYNKDKFYKYLTMIFISLTISLLIYIIFPTEMVRTNLNLLTNSFTDKVTKLIYGVGSTMACVPSLHVLLASGYLLPLIKDSKIPKLIKYFGYFTSIMIIISTLLVKQHVIYDVISAITINLVVWFFVKKYSLDKYIRRILKDNIL